MVDAPEKIWAKARLIDGWTDPIAGPFHRPDYVEYTRSDLAAKLAAENERLKKKLADHPRATNPVAAHETGNVSDKPKGQQEPVVTEVMVEAAAIAISGGRKDLWGSFDLFKRASFRTRAMHALKAAMEAGG